MDQKVNTLRQETFSQTEIQLRRGRRKTSVQQETSGGSFGREKIDFVYQQMMTSLHSGEQSSHKAYDGRIYCGGMKKLASCLTNGQCERS